MENIKFSLILPTVGRTDEIGLFLESVALQTHDNLEVIVVDQNTDDRLASILGSYQDKLNIIYLPTNMVGLSKARNLGLRYATGSIIAFPDDDCIYRRNTLEKVVQLFDDNLSADVITGRCTDELGQNSVSMFHDQNMNIDLWHLWGTHVSITIFIKAKVFEAVGFFDEQMGAGAVFGSSEETDYIIRIIYKGFLLKYFPDLTVQHPQKGLALDNSGYKRAYDYGLGQGALWRKYFFLFPITFYCAKSFLRSLIGAVLAVNNLKLCRRRLCAACGKVKGLFKYSPTI